MPLFPRSNRPATNPRSQLTRWLPALQVLEDRTVPAAFVVTTGVDEAYDGGDLAAETADGKLSLREAVGLANANGPGRGDVDGDTVTFSGVNTVTLGGTELAVTDDLTITGSNVTISGNSASRIFNLDVAASAGSVKLVTLSGLVLTKGSAAGDGGALLIAAGTDAKLTGVAVTANAAAGSGGGIANAGNLTYVAAGFGGRLINNNVANAAAVGTGGGGLFNTGTANLSGFTLEVSGNTAVQGKADGGGILNSGTLVVDGSSSGRVTGNSAARAGGGIENNAGVVTLTGLALGQFGLGGTFNTAGVNGGGLHTSGAGLVTISGGTVNQNVAGQEGGGLWNSTTGTLTVTGTTVSKNSAAGDLDPMGDDSKLQGGGGVFSEGGTTKLTNVTVSLNKATGATRGSGGGVMSLDGALTITGGTVTGNTAVRAGGGVEIVAGGATLTGVTLTGNSAGASPGNGGGLHVTGAAAVTLVDGVVSGNTAANQGGGVWNSFTGSMSATGTQFLTNSAGEGGGVYSDGGVTTFDQVAVTGNTAATDGGGVYVAGFPVGTVSGDFKLANSVVSNNVANGALAGTGGGGIFAGGPIALAATDVTGNTALVGSADGGGLLISGGLVSISGGSVANNKAARAGGGVENSGGSLGVTGTLFDGNSAGVNGGALHQSGVAAAKFAGATVSNNTAGDEGGGLWNSAAGSLTVESTDITGNAATTGGGVYADVAADGTGGALAIAGGSVSGNTAAVNGGGLAIDGGAATLTGTFVTGNAAGGDAVGLGGGGIYADATLTLVDTNILSNTATVGLGNGGGLLVDVNGLVTVTGGAISTNSAARAGGGVEVSGGKLTLDGVTTEVSLEGNTAGVNGGGLHISDAGFVTVNGATVSNNTAGQEGGGLWNSATGTLVLDGTTVTGNAANGALDPMGDDSKLQGGGGVFNDGGALSLVGVTVSGNTALGSGGGVMSIGGAVNIFDSTVTGNEAVRAGGGIEIVAGSLTVGDSTLSNNDVSAGGKFAAVAPGNGGGLHVTGESQTFIGNSTVSGNVAGNEGGGLWNSATGTLAVSGTLISNNTAQESGGGVYNDGGTVLLSTLLGVVGPVAPTLVTGNVANATAAGSGGGGVFNLGTLNLDNVTVSNNTASQGKADGGGILNSLGASLTVRGGDITGNSAARAGGGVENDAGTASFSGTTLRGNRAGVNGGALHASGAAATDFAQAIVSGNIAGVNGGGLWLTAGGALTLTETTVSGNSATRGGGVYNDSAGGAVTVTASTLSGNSAVVSGGGLFSSGGTVLFSNSTVSTNTAGVGGGIAITGGALDVRNSTVAFNTASSGGGVSAEGGSFAATSSLFGRNNASVGGDILGTLNSAGANLVSNTAGATIVSAGGDLLDVDPLLGPLQDNGGATRTHALLAGSPAINAGLNPDALEADQAGNARGQSGQTDIGAFESSFASSVNAAPVGNGDSYGATSGQTLTIVVPGILGNDTDAEGDALTVASPGSIRLVSGQGTLAVNADGSFSYTAPADFVGTATFTYQPTDGTTLGTVATVTITVAAPTPPMMPPIDTPVPPTPPMVPPTVPPTVPPARPVVGSNRVAVGSDFGGSAVVAVLNGDGSRAFTIQAFEPGFTGGVRTALADVNNDGVADVIAGSGPGRRAEVRVFDGVTGAQLFSFFPFEESFTGGVLVAAGDFDNDGFSDVVITPDQGGGPRVVVVSGKDQTRLADFFGIEDAAFRGGARVAVADVDGDGTPDILVAAGFGGGPRVAGFDGGTLAGNSPRKLFADFFVFEQTLRDGLYLAGGDLDDDGFADVIAGGGPGGGPRVFALSGLDLASNKQTQLANFFAGDPEARGGIRVAAKDFENDGLADIVVGSGTGAGSRVVSYPGNRLVTNGLPPIGFNVEAFPDFDGGVYVG